MKNFRLSTVLSLLLLVPLCSIAEEQLSFKGIKFGMKAAEIAELAGGDVEFGCASAIPGTLDAMFGDKDAWTYGGIASWLASCVEEQSDATRRVPGTSGMFQIISTVSSHKADLAKSLGYRTYSVEELADIFSEVFGKFEIETKTVQNALGQNFIKKEATATHGGAAILIAESTSGSDHEERIHLTIISLDYLSKKADWERKQNSQKLKDAKSDF